MKLRVRWEGREPAVGEFLQAERGTTTYAIERVRRASAGARPGLLLNVTPTERDRVPDGAVVHPWLRTIAVDRKGPPAVRQLQESGATAVMRSGGWRAFCPLRRIKAQGGGSITDKHIAAADRLRETADVAALGYTAPAEERAGGAAGPRMGPPYTALVRVWATAEVRRMVALFTPGQLEMLSRIVLLNLSIQAWSAEQGRLRGVRLDPKVEMGKLIAMLDILAAQYERERNADDVRRARVRV